jgi:alanine-glyoxylate transaminase/serine-glyoxylate transaminase/serine-pyruvate transaminase
MPVADFAPPQRLMAGGGPSSPHPRVLRALTTPLIGQFDPSFTRIMDQVMHRARRTLLTANARCFPLSALSSAGVEALLNTVPDGQRRFDVVDHVDARTGEIARLRDLAASSHAANRWLLVDATRSLGGLELRTDDWGLDAVVAGVDYCLGAPSGMTLVTYSDEIERAMLARGDPPRTSYLDLLQLQAYWSAERLNHHTAPTSLVYGLHEALRLLHDEGLEAAWARHARVGQFVRDGARALGLEPRGQPPYTLVRVRDAEGLRRRLLEDYGVYVTRADDETLRIGLLGADARPEVAHTLRAVLTRALAA